VFPGTSPYKAQAFQWSCHIEHQNGDIEHREFLADGREAPMRACAESLIDELGNQGPIFMYTSYERTTINGFIALFPDLTQPLQSIVDRLYDLHPLTRKNFYHPDMHGSWSIKAILPAVAPDLKYDDLDIVSNGAMAEPAFLEMIDGTTSPDRREELREALLRYCELDTLAMVRLAHYLEGRIS
jgi:predicted RecB family nuclease